jgi:hypothetical protein
MTLYHNSKQKLRNVDRTIGALLDGDFPLSSGKKALEKLRGLFAGLGKKLDRAYALKDAASEKQIASLINVKVYETLPILGFILRSTNVRNAFEVLDPLQVVADSILQGRPQLLLSSEWDYVPFAYPQSLEDLRSFVLIGLPATEAASALLLPLAGHELGHAVWRNRGIGGGAHATLQFRCENSYKSQMEEFKKYFPEYDPDDLVYKELLPEAIGLSVEYAVFQAEELFCDMFSYAIFGASYLHAFAYILAPGFGRMPGSRYPSHKTRISVLASIASKEGAKLPAIGSLSFSDETPRGNPRERFVLRVAEENVQEVIGGLWDRVLALLNEGKVLRPSEKMSEKHSEQFKLGIPAHEPRCLGDIVNAGWTCYSRMQSYVSEDENERDKEQDNLYENVDALNEILLKTIEVLEFNNRTGNGPQR